MVFYEIYDDCLFWKEHLASALSIFKSQINVDSNCENFENLAQKAHKTLEKLQQLFWKKFKEFEKIGNHGVQNKLLIGLK